MAVTPAYLEKWWRKEHLPHIKKQYGNFFYKEYVRLCRLQKGMSRNDILAKHGITKEGYFLIKGEKKAPLPSDNMFVDTLTKGPSTNLYKCVLKYFDVDEPMLRV